MRRGTRLAVRGATLLVVAAAVCALTGPTAAAPAARGPQLTLSWLGPTPADGRTFVAQPGTAFSLTLSARGPAGRKLDFRSRVLPAGVEFHNRPGNPATAKLTWTPTAAQAGTHTLVFLATARGTRTHTRPRAYFVHVPAPTPLEPQQPFPLTGPGGLSRWAAVNRAVVARARPTSGAPRVGLVPELTPEETTNLVQLLSGYADAQGRQWLRVRLSRRTNTATGWVPRDALGPARGVWTHLVVDRIALTATLYRRGRPIFRTPVGVGKSYWPTPAGDFYIRNQLTGFGNSKLYGPIAFGTSAQSAVLTDWPGGGFIGIHGTGWPWLLPGYVSHGCVRMPNPAIRRLASLLPIGTPVSIR